MLRVTLEMVPFGIESLKRTLGTMTISNVGGTRVRANYRIKMDQSDRDHHAEDEIRNYPRKNGAWNLVLLALSKIDFR